MRSKKRARQTKSPRRTFGPPLNYRARRLISTRNSKCSWRNFRRRCKSGEKFPKPSSKNLAPHKPRSRSIRRSWMRSKSDWKPFSAQSAAWRNRSRKSLTKGSRSKTSSRAPRRDSARSAVRSPALRQRTRSSPTTASRGRRDVPILIECANGHITFLQEGIKLSRADVSGFSPAYNPLRAGAQALLDYWSTHSAPGDPRPTRCSSFGPAAPPPITKRGTSWSE